ncbi:MAG TPA: hypothetical protein VK066_31240 [Chloroflexota bacterium]|nr:hypothetical protein [Chloroflexota bacterium]
MADHRYEREIDELLRHMEAENRAPLPFRRRRAAPWTAAWRRARGAVSGQSAVEQLMALAAVLMVGTLLLALLAPRFAGPLGLAALGCFLASLALSVWNGASGHPTRYHGRHSYPPAAGAAVDWDSLAWRFRRWLRRLRG